jgi:MYXO-CTERM domain-containing protein
VLPFVLQAPPASYPVAKGCGCGSTDASLIAALALLTQAARRRSKKR